MQTIEAKVTKTGEAWKTIHQNVLALTLRKISIREFLFLPFIPCTVYAQKKNGKFEVILRSHDGVNKTSLRGFIENGIRDVFVVREDHSLVRKAQQDNLLQSTRSLSVGAPRENARKHFHLLSVNMKYLYEEPTNDEILELQFNATKNLASFLAENVKYHPQFYMDYIKQKHHYIYAQPLLASLFLIGILKQSKLFSQKDIETLFITSYFKDIGMSAIPEEKYDKENLSDRDKELLLEHPVFSSLILNSRIPISVNHLKIIEAHHSISILGEELGKRSGKKEEHLIMGLETVLVTILDMIAAMISERPYRDSETLFDALERSKKFIADQYPQEFKLIVSYFKNFFSATMGKDQ